MDFLGVGPGELLVILVLALIVLGPRRLPEVAQQIGKVLGELQRTSAGFRRELNRELALADQEKPVPGADEGKKSQDWAIPNLQPTASAAVEPSDVSESADEGPVPGTDGGTAKPLPSEDKTPGVS
jgi:sec-independent protein translocase protein TatB